MHGTRLPEGNDCTSPWSAAAFDSRAAPRRVGQAGLCLEGFWAEDSSSFASRARGHERRYGCRKSQPTLPPNCRWGLWLQSRPCKSPSLPPPKRTCHSKSWCSSPPLGSLYLTADRVSCCNSRCMALGSPCKSRQVRRVSGAPPLPSPLPSSTVSCLGGPRTKRCYCDQAPPRGEMPFQWK